MATWYARQTANIDAVGVWNSAANGSGSWLTWPPAPGDVLMANGFTITVNVSAINLGATGQVRNDTTGGAAGGGRFALANNLILTANVYAGGTTVSQGLVSSFYYNLTVIGDVYAGSRCNAAANRGPVTLEIYGTVYGNDYGPGSTGITAGIHGAVNTSTGTLRVYRTVMGARGMPAVSGPFQYINPRSAQQSVRATGSLTEVILRDVVGWTPDPSDVLTGTAFEGRIGVMDYAKLKQRMTPMVMSSAARSPDAPVPGSFSSGFSDAFA